MRTTRRRPVVMVTGQLLTEEVWAPQIPRLARDFDLSFADHRSDDSIEAMARRLLDEAPERFDLVAHAMGGFVAFETLRLAPGRVRSLVLMSTLASADTEAQTERRRGYIKLVEEGQFDAVIEERLPILVHPSRSEDAPLLAILRRMARETGAAVFSAQQKAIMGRRDSRPTLAAITAPVLVIRGAQDRITTVEHRDEMLAGLPNARLEVIEDCGHMATLEKPVTTTAMLGRWLSAQPE